MGLESFPERMVTASKQLDRRPICCGTKMVGPICIHYFVWSSNDSSGNSSDTSRCISATSLSGPQCCSLSLDYFHPTKVATGGGSCGFCCKLSRDCLHLHHIRYILHSVQGQLASRSGLQVFLQRPLSYHESGQRR